MGWITDRIKERTSWDGIAIIAVSAVVLFLGPFAAWAAYAGIAWGAWTMWKKEGEICDEDPPSTRGW